MLSMLINFSYKKSIDLWDEPIEDFNKFLYFTKNKYSNYILYSA